MNIGRIIFLILFSLCLLSPGKGWAEEHVIYSYVWKGGIQAWNYLYPDRYMPMIEVRSKRDFIGRSRIASRGKDWKILEGGMSSHDSAACILYSSLTSLKLKRDVGRVSGNFNGKTYYITSASNPYGFDSVSTLLSFKDQACSKTGASTGSINTADTQQEDTYYDAEAGRWRSRSFDSHWRELMTGSAAFQARMRSRGYIWDDIKGGWVDTHEIADRQRRETIEKYIDFIIRRSEDLTPEQQEIAERIARQLRSSDDSAQALARMQRLRNATHLMASAEVDRAESELAQLEQREIVMDTVTSVIPFVDDSRDFYEAISGVDAWTGRELAWWERGLLIVPLLGDVTQAMRRGARATESVRDAQRRLNQITDVSADTGAIKHVNGMARSGEVSEELLSHVHDAKGRIVRFERAKELATKKTDQFVAALKTQDDNKILKAMVEVQGDWQAVTAINRRINFVKKKFNDHLGKLYKEVDKGMIRRIAAKHGVDPKDVKILNVTNPSAKVKVGKDRDITVSIFGKQLSETEVAEVYGEELFRTLKRRKALPRGVKTPKEAMEKMDQTAVWFLGTEAYSRRDLPTIIEARQVRLNDPRGVALTVQHKGIHHFNDAKKHLKAGSVVQAERDMAEGFYQVRKQFDNQLTARVEFARQLNKNVKLPQRLEAAIDITRKIESWDLSPAEAEALLKPLGYTPQKLAEDVGNMIESIDVLLAASLKK